MITAAQLILDRKAAGLPILDDFDHLPAFQMDARFQDLAPVCPNRLDLDVPARRANALNVEVGQPLPRCSARSPDGRGLAWILSGGSALAFGLCDRSACFRCGREKP